MTESRPPFPPLTLHTARQKVQAAENAWNTRDPEQVSLAYTVDSQWRNRDEHVVGRDEIVAFLIGKILEVSGQATVPGGRAEPGDVVPVWVWVQAAGSRVTWVAHRGELGDVVADLSLGDHAV